ncbi:MAG TPA: hypothetical protein IAA84_07800 [Candidatus Alectryocaccomicrobium excrementavium]|uniref:Uncharacterized protein n=1 Tax=Candidatus Alectryocaccomicrobium excrementavium TaxID=2840668 RepID=A0A9D1G0L5_9FIRM|nr:hypothetical protein [Candidatus Alectryocaccomicrobium excrementavium]
MANNTHDEQRMDYYEFKRKHEEWLKTFADVRRNVEDSHQRPAPVPSRQPPEDIAAGSAPTGQESVAGASPEPPAAGATGNAPPEDDLVDVTTAAAGTDAQEDVEETPPDTTPTAPEIPEIFIGEEKFNTAPIEKAAEEFLTGEELGEDEREPNPFDSLFHAVDMVKEKLAAIRRKRHPIEEEIPEEEDGLEDLDDAATIPPRDAWKRRTEKKDAASEPATPPEMPSGDLSQTQKLRQRFGRPETEIPPADVIQDSETAAKSKGGHTMPEQDSKNSAALSQLLSEGMSGPTLSRRERRMIEQKNDSEESPTQVYRPVRETAANAASNITQFDEDDDEEEEIVPRKQKPGKKAKVSRTQREYEDDFDDITNFDDFDDEPEEMPAKRGKPAKKAAFREEDEDDYDDDYEDEGEEDYDEDEDEDYDEDEDDSSIGKRVLNVLKGIFIVILVLALLFVALRLLEGQGIVRLTGLRGVINSISPEAAEWLLPEPEAQQDSGSDDLPSLDNDGFDNSFTDDSANFGPVDGTGTTGVDAGAAAGGNLFPTASPTVAPTSAPTATPTAAPTEVPFDDSQLSADDIFNALP